MNANYPFDEMPEVQKANPDTGWLDAMMATYEHGRRYGKTETNSFPNVDDEDKDVIPCEFIECDEAGNNTYAPIVYPREYTSQEQINIENTRRLIHEPYQLRR